MKKIYLILSALIFPFAALAVTVDTTDVTLKLPSDSTNYTLKGFSKFDSLQINSSSFDFTISAGGIVTLESTDRKQLTNTQNVTTDCQSGKSVVTVGPGPLQTTATVTITPAGTCGAGGGGVSSGGGGGGGGGSGGGGGGGSSSPAPAPAPAPAPVPAPAPAPLSHPSVSFSKDMQLGDNNQDVLQLQALLSSDPAIYPEGLATGYFGPATQRAVKKFQAKYGLSQVGRVGPATRAKLVEVFGGASTAATPPPPVLEASTVWPKITKIMSRGASGDEVKTVQEFLAKDATIYPEGTVSGYFGALTEKAVQRFQEKYSIAQAGDTGYGVVGPKTRAKLNELMGSGTAKIPSEADQLEALQKQLKTLQDQLKAFSQ